MPEQKTGECPICKKKNVPLNVKEIKFDNIRCLCCAPSCHVVSSVYCNNCSPKEPKEQIMVISVKELKKLNEAYRLVKDKPPFNQ